MARELKDINQEYGTVCAQLGDKVYQSLVLNQNIQALQKRCFELQQEGAAVIEATKGVVEVANVTSAAE